MLQRGKIRRGLAAFGPIFERLSFARPRDRRSARRDGTGNDETQSTGYNPEFLWSYEVGVKSQWLEKRLRLNVDAFYYDYSDLQVELFTPPANAFTQNAAAASVKGLEAEFVGRPLPSVDLYANIAYLDAQYDS